MRKKSFIKPIRCVVLLCAFNLAMLTPLGMISKAQISETAREQQ